MSRLASILSCLLALLVASPLCCCAAEQSQVKEEKKSSCCCGGEGDEQRPDHTCACASDDPREAPAPLLPAPPAAANPLSLEPACIWLPLALRSDADLRPAWVPPIPWHAPPSQRRALLVSRTL